MKTYNGPLEHTPEVGKQLTDRVMIVDCIVIVEMLVHIFSSEIVGLQVHHKQQNKLYAGTTNVQLLRDAIE